MKLAFLKSPTTSTLCREITDLATPLPDLGVLTPDLFKTRLLGGGDGEETGVGAGAGDKELMLGRDHLNISGFLALYAHRTRQHTDTGGVGIAQNRKVVPMI